MSPRSSLFPAALVVLVCVALARAGGEDLPESPVCEALKRATVTVSTTGGSGSGAIVVHGGRAWVLTAAHVVDSCRKVVDRDGKKEVCFDDCKVIQKVVQDGRIVSDVTYDAEVIRYSDSEYGEDLALLRLYQKDAFKDGVKFYLGNKPPPIGTRLYHAGSPLGDIGSQSIIPGLYSAHGRLLDKRIYDQISCSAFPGSSGGTMALEDGRWVGMVLRGREGGFILVRPVRVVKVWAKRVGVDFVLDPSLPAPTDDELKKQPVDESQKKESKP